MSEYIEIPTEQQLNHKTLLLFSFPHLQEYVSTLILT